MIRCRSKRFASRRAGDIAILGSELNSNSEDDMLTLCIRYTLDATKLADFEAYGKSAAGPIERCGGKLVGYFAPTKFAGPTNAALALIDFPSLAAYEQYRERLAVDPEASECLRRVEKAGSILVEDRTILRRVTGGTA
jgi:NIPSNAP protein